MTWIRTVSLPEADDRLRKAIEGEKLGGVGPGVSPKTALSVGLKVDADALRATHARLAPLISARTRVAYVLGHPIQHSKSPAMQTAAFRAAGIDALMVALDVDLPATDLYQVVESLRWSIGASVTTPLKERIAPALDGLAPSTGVPAVVNCIQVVNGKLVGHNTDVPAFRVVLDKLVGKQKMPKQAVVLGAGGGARAVVFGLITEGFQRVIVFNRHLHRAEGMVKHFTRSAAHMELRAMPWHESIIEAELAKSKVLVNATSIGLVADEPGDDIGEVVEVEVIGAELNPPGTMRSRDFVGGEVRGVVVEEPHVRGEDHVVGPECLDRVHLLRRADGNIAST